MQIAETPKDPMLPALRPDLQILPGPVSDDGSPTFLIYDPLLRTYDKIGWAEKEILTRMRAPQLLSALMEDLRLNTTLRPDTEDVVGLCSEAVRMGLTSATSTRPVPDLIKTSKAKKLHPLKWLLHHYLYFRIPLLRPDRFLERTVPYVRTLWSRPALIFYVLVFLLGFLMLTQRFVEFLHTFPYFFNPAGLLWYGLAVAGLKIVHEFAHAYVARAHGVRVPVMGVAFMVMWPMAYCDVTDAWRLVEKRKRVSIAAAGMASEIVIAGFCLIGWGLTPPGMAHSIFFVLSSATLIGTLLVNLNPGMRFDGYYILMDLWGIDNLQTRSIAASRWALRKWILGLEMDPPEDGLTRNRLIWMVIYTIYVWIYRFFLYLGIALMVYYKFTKALGMFLFAVEIIFFLIKPVYQEVTTLISLRSHFKLNPRLIIFLTVCTLALLWLALPLPRSFTAPAIAVPEEKQVIYAPGSGMALLKPMKRNSRIEKGQELLTILSPDLDAELSNKQLQLEFLKREREQLAMDDQDKSYLQQKDKEITRLRAEIEGLDQQRESNRILAEISGVLLKWDESLYEGQFLHKDSVLGMIADPKKLTILAFVDEDRIADIQVGDTARFTPLSGGAPHKGHVMRISPVRTEIMDHKSLTSAAKGLLPVMPDSSNRLIMLESRYSVEIALDSNQGILPGQSGEVALRTRPRSLMVHGFRAFFQIVRREVSF